MKVEITSLHMVGEFFLLAKHLKRNKKHIEKSHVVWYNTTNLENT